MNIKRFCQLIGATVILNSIIIVPAHAEALAAPQPPTVETIVFDTLGDYLPMQDELAELQQQEPEIYNELIWELYDIAESYKMIRIEADAETAELYLQSDLKDLETEWLAMEYLEARHYRNSPAIDEYKALTLAAEALFDLETRIRDLENEQIWSKLTPEHRAELTRWENYRLSIKNEWVQRKLDAYLNPMSDIQAGMQWMEFNWAIQER